MQQRSQKILDTRPHREAGHHTEIIKRLAASGVQDSKTPVPSNNMMLNAPSTQANSVYKKAHTVQDTSVYNDYTAGQAVASSAMPINAKTPQINAVCYSSTTIPEYNDLLRTDDQAALKQAAKNAYGRGYSSAACCIVCGKPPVFGSACNCALTTTQRVALKDQVGTRIHTAS